MLFNITQAVRVSLLTLLFLSASGCSLVYKGLGETMHAYSEARVIADFMAYEDVDLLCTAGTSLYPLLQSFKQVGTDTEISVSPLMLLSGFCEIQLSHQYQVEEMLADHAGHYQNAMNFAVLKQRAISRAAWRQYRSYEQALIAYPSEPGQCPEFAIDQDELVFLLGNLQGLEALVNDGKSGLQVNVPRNIANRIYREMDCLDSTKWWGVPEAVQASLLVFLPELDREKSQSVDAILWRSVELGRQQLTPLSETVALVAWSGKGAEAQVERLLASHYEYMRKLKDNPQYQAIALISHRHLDNAMDILRLQDKKLMTINPGEPYFQSSAMPDAVPELMLDDI